MNKLFMAIALLPLLVSCDQNIEPGVTRLRVYEQSAVKQSFPLVETGDNIVFHFFRSEPNDPNIVDEEFAEDFLFEINGSVESFDYSSEDLALYNIPLVYRQYCFCAGFNEVTMSTFDLKGTKQSNGDWILDADLILTPSYIDDEDQIQNQWNRRINVKGRFIKTPRPHN